MASRLIIYFGAQGLETGIFRTYMSSAGYTVHTVTARPDLLTAVRANPDAVAVIASDAPPAEIIELVHDTRREAAPTVNRIFVLTAVKFDGDVNGMEVIARPFRLSELVKRLHALRSRPDE